MMRTETKLKRLRLEISGIVQGVGFRPFVFNAAQKFGIKGFVGNDAHGVFIEAEAGEKSLRGFENHLRENPPPLAHITGISVKEIAVESAKNFEIFESENRAEDFTFVSPDMAVCEDCRREFFDPADRRFRYPFINCTNCGPRFTITERVPYDRPNTTMRGFEMCAECLREYENPADRRFHAQPNACPECGPKVWLQTPDSAAGVRENVFETVRNSLKNGGIAAVKGIGGFHLACDARNDAALDKLRARKGRIDKPFAVMCRDLAAAESIAEISPGERGLLTSRARPIVLLKKKASALSGLVAPNNNFIGVMLPYAPLHYLLFENDLDCLVMTSGNFSNEPIVSDNDEALEKLAPLADAFLLHDRPIFVACDDSVMRLVQSPKSEVRIDEAAFRRPPSAAVLPIRRSRGYAPFPVELPFAVPPVLAVGGELKAAFCLTRERFALMSQHIGDMENLETLEAFEKSLAQLKSVFRVEPEIIACDRHPNYLSSKWARDNFARLGAKLVEIQHHRAHIASVMAENRLGADEKVIGFAFDGTGFGDDGAIWGGEVFVGGYDRLERAARLEYFPLAGGDSSVKNVWRVALTLLRASGVDWSPRFACVEKPAETERRILLRQLENNLNVVSTSSFGRLFDAVASIAGVRQRATYEAQAAIEFEALIDEREDGFYEFGLTAGDTIISWKNLIREVASDVSKGVAAAKIAAKFHHAVARLIRCLSVRTREKTGLNKIALSGGCFQNVALLEKSRALLDAAGFEVLTHERVPPNDGGLALGQAVLAALGQGESQK